MGARFLFKELFLEEVGRIGGGVVNCHAHLDRAFTLTPEIWEQSQALMERKWILMRDIKTGEKYSKETLEKRLSETVDSMIEQGISACRTHVDADSIVEMDVVESAARVREKYKGKFILQLVAHPLEGFPDKNSVDLFEKACTVCDAVGGLPSRDRALSGGSGRHADIIFSIAKNLNKDLDIHIDQENNPDERDTEMILDKIYENGMQGRVTLLHAISLACQPGSYRREIIEKLKDTGTNVTVCPRAAIGMTQLKDKTAPIHNSIAPVTELLDAGVNVGIGTDNISDIFIPNSCGDLFDEINLLADGVRLYDIGKLAKIATVNGRRILKLNHA